MDSRTESYLRWAAVNGDLLQKLFDDSLREGSRTFGLRFVRAQEAAIAAGFAGIMPPLPYDVPLWQKAQIASMVLAVMKVCKPNEEPSMEPSTDDQ